jgi:hypothetical protein
LVSNVRAAEAESRSKIERTAFNVDYRGPRWLRRAVGIEHLKPFHRVTELTFLRSSPPEFARAADQFPRLEALSISLPNLSDAELRHVSRLTALQFLDLDSTQFSANGLDALRPLRRLRVLQIDNAPQVTSDAIAPLSDMKELVELHLRGTRIDNRGLRHLVGLQQLEVLNLESSLIDDEGLRELGRLKNLRELGLAGTKLNGSGLVHLASLRNLTGLDLDRTAVGDDALLHLEALQLTRLNVRGTQMTAAAIEKFREKIPRCRIIFSPPQ